jgi:hypothetical protein
MSSARTYRRGFRTNSVNGATRFQLRNRKELCFMIPGLRTLLGNRLGAFSVGISQVQETALTSRSSSNIIGATLAQALRAKLRSVFSLRDASANLSQQDLAKRYHVTATTSLEIAE